MGVFHNWNWKWEKNRELQLPLRTGAAPWPRRGQAAPTGRTAHPGAALPQFLLSKKRLKISSVGDAGGYVGGSHLQCPQPARPNRQRRTLARPCKNPGMSRVGMSPWGGTELPAMPEGHHPQTKGTQQPKHRATSQGNVTSAVPPCACRTAAWGPSPPRDTFPAPRQHPPFKTLSFPAYLPMVLIHSPLRHSHGPTGVAQTQRCRTRSCARRQYPRSYF